MYFARDQKKIWNMKVVVLPIVVGALETFPKGLEESLEGQEIKRNIESVLTIALLTSARIFKSQRIDVYLYLPKPTATHKMRHKVDN